MTAEPLHDIGHQLPDEEFHKLVTQAEEHGEVLPPENLAIHAEFLRELRQERGL